MSKRMASTLYPLALVISLVGLSSCKPETSNNNSGSNSGEVESMPISASEIATLKAADGQGTESIIGIFTSMVEARVQQNSVSAIVPYLQKELDARFEIKCAANCEIKEREMPHE
jgi:hypothetical protein